MSTVMPVLEKNQGTTHDQYGTPTIEKIQQLITDSGVNKNSFYATFKTRRLDRNTLKRVFQQYYYYIRTFPQFLAGLSGRVGNEFVRMKLARTVVSELGDNGEGKPHFEMFQDVMRAVDVELDDWTSVTHIEEAEALVSGLRRLFLEKSPERALGAHYVIEEFGFPMIVALYEGFNQYDGWEHEDYSYFYLHLLIEANHVDWISDAILESCATADIAIEMQEGAEEVLKLLGSFWRGLDRLAKQ